jgi:hypothetical protein
MDIRQAIEEILSDERPEDAYPSKAEVIEELIPVLGWEAVRDYLFNVLRDDRRQDAWRIAADVFWGAVLDGRKLPADELIAW